eukprot:scaffold66878_cov30-Tisochrysis_lutea.AAC.1
MVCSLDPACNLPLSCWLRTVPSCGGGTGRVARAHALAGASVSWIGHGHMAMGRSSVAAGRRQERSGARSMTLSL